MNCGLTYGRFIGVSFVAVDYLSSLGAIGGTDDGVFCSFLSGESGIISGGFAVNVADLSGFFDNEGSGGGSERGGLHSVLVGRFVLLFSVGDDEHELTSFIVVEESTVHGGFANATLIDVNHGSYNGSLFRTTASSRAFNSE